VTGSAQPTMTSVVGVHGIGNHHYLTDTGSVAAAAGEISADWTRGVIAGLSGIGDTSAATPDVRVAYYSHLLHRGTPQGDVDPAHLDDEAQDLLIAWVEQLLAAPEPSIAQGERTARARAAADWLTRHLGQPVSRGAISFCREVSAYLSKPARRQAVRDAVAETLAACRPRIVIAHSLGSVVAYETLWRSGTGIDLLLTLGSPLAMPGAIFDRLDPAPVNGRGSRPPCVAHWVNLADVGDFVAIPRAGLSSRFDGLDYDNPAIVIDEREFHGIELYLACPDTAAVLARYLRGDR
jgi:hypothetical protein